MKALVQSQHQELESSPPQSPAPVLISPRPFVLFVVSKETIAVPLVQQCSNSVIIVVLHKLCPLAQIIFKSFLQVFDSDIRVRGGFQ